MCVPSLMATTGWVDPDRLGKGVGLWDPSYEAFRVMGPGGLKGSLTLFQHAVGSMMMDILWGEHRDPSVAMLGVVPGEERSAEGDGSGEVVEVCVFGSKVITDSGRK